MGKAFERPFQQFAADQGPVHARTRSSGSIRTACRRVSGGALSAARRRSEESASGLHGSPSVRSGVPARCGGRKPSPRRQPLGDASEERIPVSIMGPPRSIATREGLGSLVRARTPRVTPAAGTAGLGLVFVAALALSSTVHGASSLLVFLALVWVLGGVGGVVGRLRLSLGYQPTWSSTRTRPMGRFTTPTRKTSFLPTSIGMATSSSTQSAWTESVAAGASTPTPRQARRGLSPKTTGRRLILSNRPSSSRRCRPVSGGARLCVTSYWSRGSTLKAGRRPGTPGRAPRRRWRRR